MNDFKNIIGFLLLIISVFVFGLKGMAVEMGIAVAASGVFLAFVNLEKFSKFKGAGFEAELKQVVLEANVTIDNLKAVAIPLLATNIDLLANDGRWGGSDIGFDKNHELYDQLVSLQENIGISDELLESIKMKYINIHAWDMIGDLAERIEKAGNEKFALTVRNAVGQHEFNKTPDIQVLDKLLATIEIKNDDKIKFEVIQNYYKKYGLSS